MRDPFKSMAEAAQMEIAEDIVIVGAGIAGLSSALGLHRFGLRCLVIESSEQLRVTGFALTLWTNAWKALDALGIADYLRKRSLQMQGFQVVAGQKEIDLPLGETYKDHEARCVKRKDLLETLVGELPPGTIRFSSTVVSLDISGHSKSLQLADGNVVRCKVLIGGDGVNSIVARWLGLQNPVNTRRSAIRGLVDIPNHGFKPKFYVHFGNGVRMGFIPCDDNSVYWFCTFKQTDDNWLEDMVHNPVEMKRFVLKKTSNMPKEVSDIVERTDLDSISCAALKFRFPWDLYMKDIAKNGIFVAGDALHPMTPDLGQGGCSALEDGVVLARCIGQSFLKIPSTDDRDEKEAQITQAINTATKTYVKERRWRSVSLITVAYTSGFIQESDAKLITLFREKIFSRYTATIFIKMGDFDCGKLSSSYD